MRDISGNQYVLGTFIATFIYCLLVLSSVTHSNGDVCSCLALRSIWLCYWPCSMSRF
ncbi:DUF2254 family protein [Photobacterium arenosum]|uniref:DUF2254 family protein n=1 Tax=Photobacterium arenosum TaxID=2774143 RepID=UPI0035CFD51C